MAQEEMEIDEEVGEERSDALEQKRINEEYKIWKKNVPFLYDTLYARALKWPTLTAQWLPDVQEVNNGELRQHRLLVGTNTANGEPNYLEIIHVRAPKVSYPDSAEFNESTNEIGGYQQKEKFEFEVRQQIKHPSEVNKARYMPQNPDIIATWSVNDGVLIWDRTKHTLDASKDKGEPDITCEGHEKEGFGLSWSPHTEGHLASASEDETVKLWDIVAASKKGAKKIESMQSWSHHSSVVNDVQHHPLHKSWIATASDDLSWAVIDPRQSTSKPPAFQVQEAHTDAVNAIACHPKFEFTIATGSADKTVALWDLRCADKKVHSIEAHQDAVIQLQWHPQEPAILTSGSYDRRIIIYDLSRTGEEQTEEEAEEGAPELLFMHGGFTNRLTEFDWNKNDPWWMLAAAEDNQLQIFRPARALVNTPPKKAVTIGEVEE